MTVCNMSIEGGARAGYVNPDETTFAYLKGRPYSPKGAAWDAAVARWKSFRERCGLSLRRRRQHQRRRHRADRHVGHQSRSGHLDQREHPDPAKTTAVDEKASIEEALAYMKLPPGAPIKGTKIDVAFIGSCTNGRLSDFQEVAKFVKGRKVAPQA